MRADLAARLRKTMRGEIAAKTGVTGVVGVAQPFRHVLKPAELRQLRPLRVKNDDLGKTVFGGVIDGVPAFPEANEDAVLERAGLCADSFPSIYLDAWSRLNCQRPASVSDAEWRQAQNDGGLFLDAWGAEAAQYGWTVGDLFSIPGGCRPGGLIWSLTGALVEAFGRDRARLSDGRSIEREGL